MEIPSPYWLSEQEEQMAIERDLIELRRKYRLNQLFIAFSKKGDNPEEDFWRATSNTISDGMVEYLEICINNMKEDLEK